MPEGDTVWNTARVLERALTGDALTASDFRVPQLATTDLGGWTVTESASRGKHLLLRLTRDGHEPLTLHSHLRMEGAWRAYAPKERWTSRPAHLIRVVLHSARSVAVGYHLHEVALYPTAEEEKHLGHLGPDLLGADWDVDEAVRRIAEHPGTSIADALLDQRNLAGVEDDFSTKAPSPAELVGAGYWVEEEAVRRLRGHPDQPIGGALLDQRNLAGLGTVCTAEVLFLSGISPKTAVSQVANLSRVVRLARRLLWANRGRSERVTTGDSRRGQTLWVYGRRGQPCRRCGTPIEKGTHGVDDYDRVAYWCPSCQRNSAA